VRSTAKYIIVSVLFACISFAIYSNTLESEFIFDSERIKESLHLKMSSLSVESLSKAVFNDKFSKYRPFPSLTFALDYYFGGYDITQYHITNITFHIITGILLFWFFEILCRQLLPQTKPSRGSALAFAAALVWLVHPVNTQSVTYIVQRSNTMATLFCLLSIIWYHKGRISSDATRQKVFLSGAVFTWLVALGCKQNAAILPFFLFLYEWFCFQDLNRAWLKDRWKLMVGVLLLFLVCAAIFLGPHPVEKLSSLRDFSEAEFSYSERVLTQLRVVIYYLGLFFYPNPSRLTLDYDFPLSTSLFNPVTTILAAFAIAGLLFIAGHMARKNRVISLSIFWYFIFLFIESSFIPLALIYEHRTYMPYMGIALITVVLADRLLKPTLPKLVLLCLTVVIGAVWTYQRNQDWKDPLTFWQDVVTKAPDKARPYNNLGLVFYDQD